MHAILKLYNSFIAPIGLSESNVGLLAIGLPIGMDIGIAVGSAMDKKAKEKGKQLDVDL